MAELFSSKDGDLVVGQDGNDALTAVHNNVTLSGGPGIDALESSVGVDNTTMDGGPGDDDLIGFGTNDTASYANDPGSVTVDLSAQQATDGYGNTDLLFRIEHVTGSNFADELTGNSGANVLQGNGGDDTLTGGTGDDVFKYSFNLEQSPGDAKTLKFTDWLSEKYGKDFGDELPDFERGHHHHHGKHHHHDHGKHHHGKHHQHDHGKEPYHAKHDHHHSHHHKHGGCDDHQPNEWGLSQAFFAKNYAEWIREVVVADLVAQGLDLDVNGDGQIGVRLNANDPGGTPWIEGLGDEELSAIFGDRDDVTLRHHHHGHDKWYSNSYTSSSGGDQTTVASEDDFDTIIDFKFGEDQLEFSGLGSDFTLDQFTTFFEKTESDVNTDGVTDTILGLADGTWGVTLLSESGHTLEEFYDVSVFS